MTHRFIPRKEAWTPRDDEVDLPVDHSRKLKFRRAWFKRRNLRTFSTFLPKRFPKDQPWNVLTIGVFEAAQEVWLMQHCLQHADSRLVCVDPWLPTSKLSADFMDRAYTTARDNLRYWKGQVELIRSKSAPALWLALDDGEIGGVPAGQFDLIIIDGDHMAEAFWLDAVLSLQLLKVGGWMLCDDVRQCKRKPEQVELGLLRLFKTHGDRIRLVWAHHYCDCYERVV